MAESYYEGKTPPTSCDTSDLRDAAEQIIPEYLRAMDELAFHRALEAAWRLVSAVDRYIVAREPWKHFKEHGADSALARVIWNCLEALRIAFVMVAPVMPKIASEGLSRIGGNESDIGAEALSWGRLENGVPLRSGDALFPVIDAAAFLETKKMEETKPPVEATEAAPPDLAKISID